MTNTCFWKQVLFLGHVAQEELRVKQRAVMRVGFQARSEPLRVVRSSSKQFEADKLPLWLCRLCECAKRLCRPVLRVFKFYIRSLQR